MRWVGVVLGSMLLLVTGALTLARLPVAQTQFMIFQSGQAGDEELYRTRLDGTEAQNLTHTSGYDEFESWSPDGQWLIFTSTRTGNQDIYRMHLNGSDVQNLTNNAGHDDFESWSPDGQWLIFRSASAINWEMHQRSQNDSEMPNRDANFDLYRMRLDGSARQNLVSTGADDHFYGWSPDGEWLIFVSNHGVGFHPLSRVNIDGGDISEVKSLAAYSPRLEIRKAFMPIVDLSWQPRWGILAGLSICIFSTGWMYRRAS